MGYTCQRVFLPLDYLLQCSDGTDQIEQIELFCVDRRKPVWIRGNEGCVELSAQRLVNHFPRVQNVLDNFRLGPGSVFPPFRFEVFDLRCVANFLEFEDKNILGIQEFFQGKEIQSRGKIYSIELVILVGDEA